MEKKALYFAVGIVAILMTFVIFKRMTNEKDASFVSPRSFFPTQSNKSTTPTITPSPTQTPIPISKTLPTNYHIFQSFNNCGPASLSMALSHYGINVSQEVLGNKLRPYQIHRGDNDDKSVTLKELAKEAESYGFIPFHRPAGNPEIMKRFIANDMPVITRTWTKPDEDIGHYRVVKGYNEQRGVLVQDDSLQGKNLEYTYEEFDQIWKKFNYEYLVLVPKEKVQIAEQILGEYTDEKNAWEKAISLSESQLKENPDDIYARFNLSVALFYRNEYVRSKNEYEKVEARLPFRTLWYQIEPIETYVALKEYDRALSIIERILNNQNRAFSELYVIRGNIYEKQGNPAAAQYEYDRALVYNKNITF